MYSLSENDEYPFYFLNMLTEKQQELIRALAENFPYAKLNFDFNWSVDAGGMRVFFIPSFKNFPFTTVNLQADPNQHQLYYHLVSSDYDVLRNKQVLVFQNLNDCIAKLAQIIDQWKNKPHHNYVDASKARELSKENENSFPQELHRLNKELNDVINLGKFEMVFSTISKYKNHFVQYLEERGFLFDWTYRDCSQLNINIDISWY
jgi:DNA-binding transcriptional MerR regulator